MSIWTVKLKMAGPSSLAPSTSLTDTYCCQQLPNEFVEQSQRSMLPSFLQIWPVEIFKRHFNMTLVAQVPARPTCISPVNVLYSVNVALVVGHPK